MTVSAAGKIRNRVVTAAGWLAIGMKTGGIILDKEYMVRALELAERGMGRVNPNPLVGAVIVKNGRIIGEGWHEYYGGPHAEVNAVNNAKEDVKGATIYVTLEPCSHQGKTPPCAELLKAAGFGRVVVAMTDPNPLVAGRGIALLRQAGITVEVGLCEGEARRLNEIFIHYILSGLPFVIMKSAMTLDGKTATAEGESKWITGPASRDYVHRIRHRVSGIMVGIGTVLSDDPSLTARTEEGCDPIRIIVDTHLRIPMGARVLQGPGRTIIAATADHDKQKYEALAALDAVEVLIAGQAGSGVDLPQLMRQLGAKGIDSVLLEGGSELNWSMVSQGLVDKVMMFIAPKILGGGDAKTPVGGPGFPGLDQALVLEDIEVLRFGEDTLIEGYLKRGDGNVHGDR